MRELNKPFTESYLFSKTGSGNTQPGCRMTPIMSLRPPRQTLYVSIREAYDMCPIFFDTAGTYGTAEHLLGKSFKNPKKLDHLFLPKSLYHKQHHEELSIILFKIKSKTAGNNYIWIPFPWFFYIVLRVMFFYSSLIDVLHELKQRGIVKKWVITTFGLSLPVRAIEYPKIFSFIQIPYNLLDQLTLSVIESHPNAPLFTFIVRSIFLQGLLTKKKTSYSTPFSPLNPFKNKMEKIATRFDLSLSETCLRYVAYNSSIGITIFGTQSNRKLRTNLNNYLKGPINTDIIEVIDDISVERLDLLDLLN